MSDVTSRYFTKLSEFIKAVESAENLGFDYRMSRFRGENGKSEWILTIKEDD
ncbi:hypothetical protein [Salibacterium aidingense]|uniref:hypothetical protein n=1 Tax=Salibacterium aidingense TaxID=384933 RepID=UPI003BCF1175